jgi:hypothetical protein
LFLRIFYEKPHDDDTDGEREEANVVVAIVCDVGVALFSEQV